MWPPASKELFADVSGPQGPVPAKHGMPIVSSDRCSLGDGDAGPLIHQKEPDLTFFELDHGSDSEK